MADALVGAVHRNEKAEPDMVLPFFCWCARQHESKIKSAL
jgi:hypothetical protein